MILFRAEAILASSTSKIWHWNTTSRWRRSQFIHWINQLHFLDPLHRFRRKLWTSTYLGHEPYLPASKGCWRRELVKMEFRNLQSLFVCPLILWRVSSTEDDRFFGWLSRLTSLILNLCLPFTLLHWMNEAALRYWNSMDSILADKVLKMTQKRFPIYHVCPKCLAALSLRLGFPIERLSITSGIGWGGNDTGRLVTWEFPLRTDSASWKSFESFIQLTSFCKSCILPVSSKIVSWSSTYLLLAIVSKVELWNFFNSSISLRLLWWPSRNSEFCCNNCSWRGCWSRRWSSSA